MHTFTTILTDRPTHISLAHLYFPEVSKISVQLFLFLDNACNVYNALYSGEEMPSGTEISVILLIL